MSRNYKFHDNDKPGDWKCSSGKDFLPNEITIGIKGLIEFNFVLYYSGKSWQRFAQAEDLKLFRIASAWLKF